MDKPTRTTPFGGPREGFPRDAARAFLKVAKVAQMSIYRFEILSLRKVVRELSRSRLPPRASGKTLRGQP